MDSDFESLLILHAKVLSSYLEYSSAMSDFEQMRRSLISRGYDLSDIYSVLRNQQLPGFVLGVTVSPETPIDGLTARSSNVLRAEGIRTVGQLYAMTESQLLRFPNFGRRCLREVREYLAECGYQLKQ